MSGKTLLLAMAMPGLGLLTACGNDLESRNAAAGVDTYAPPEMTIESSNAGNGSGNRIVASEGAPSDFGSQDTTEQEEAARTGSDFGRADDEEVVVDASPDDLVDSAQGFSPEPMDDASGFDPSPIPPDPMVN